MISWTDLLSQIRYDRSNIRYSGTNSYAPKILVWNVTSRCNLHCRHCYYPSSDRPNPYELSQEEAIVFIEDLARAGVSVLLFSGGEPLLRKDLFTLARFAKDKGIKLALSTNGTLIDQKTARKIKEAGFYYCGISIDGRKKTNDTFRQSEGAFQRSVEAIRNCQRAGLKTGLRFTLTKYNFRDLPDIFGLVEGESIQRLCIYHLVYTGRGKDIREMELDHREKREILELVWLRTTQFLSKGRDTEVLTVDNHADGVWLYLKLKRMDPERASRVLQMLWAQGGNSSGVRIGAVDDCGNIYPDQFLRSHKLGNIREKRFSDIWQDEGSSLLKALRNRKPLLKGRCQRCNFLAICNGNLRARAESTFDDLWAEDPACYLTEDETLSS